MPIRDEFPSKNQLRLALKEHRFTKPPARNSLNGPSDLSSMLTAASIVTPSPAGDIMGMAGDAMSMYRNPEQRTLSNIGLSLLGALPFIPAGMIKLAPALKVTGGKILPGKFGGMHFQILDDLKKNNMTDDDVLDDGFIDDVGTYYTRKEAIMKAREQAPKIKTLDKNKLFSEDIIVHHGLDPPFFR